MFSQSSQSASCRSLGAAVLLAAAALSHGSARAEDNRTTEVVESLATPADKPDPILTALPIDDADPESSVPSTEQAMKNPLNMGYFLMALADKADMAAARGDFASEAKFYRAMVKAVPDRSIGYRKACVAHEKARDIDKAIEMCRGALGASGATVEDHVRLVKVTLKAPEAPVGSELADLDAVIARLGGELKLNETVQGQQSIAELKCQVGAKVEDPERLAACTKELHALKADPAKMLAYDLALRVSEGDTEGAQRVITEARTAGLPEAALDAMQRAVSKADKSPHKATFLVRRWWPLAALFVGFFVFLALKMRRRTPLPAV